MKSIARVLVSAICVLVVPAAAFAAPVTYSFTGTMLDGFGFDGQTVAGSLTVDSALLPVLSTDGATYNVAGTTTFAPSFAAIVGSLSLSGSPLVVTVGSGTQHDDVVTVLRNYTGVVNSYNVAAATDNQSISLSVTQVSPVSTVFNTPAGDLSIPQAVNWLTPGAVSVGTFSSGSIIGSFNLTSVTATVVTAVPEPSAPLMMLSAVAVMAALARRRRR